MVEVKPDPKPVFRLKIIISIIIIIIINIHFRNMLVQQHVSIALMMCSDVLMMCLLSHNVLKQEIK